MNALLEVDSENGFFIYVNETFKKSTVDICVIKDLNLTISQPRQSKEHK